MRASTLLLVALLLAGGGTSLGAKPGGQRPLDTDPARWRAWQGRVVKAITAKGLKRTRVWRLRHHLDTRIGMRFDAERFAHDVRRIRNLEVYHGIRVAVEAVTGGVAIRFRMKDKWSLLPYFNVFFNLGSVNVITGVHDVNVLGTLSYVDLQMTLFSYLPLTKDSIKPGGKFTVGIPRLFGRPFSYWLYTRAVRSITTAVGDRGTWAGAWEIESYGGTQSFGWQPWPWLSTSLTHALSWNRYRGVRDGPEPLVRRPLGGLTHAVGWTFSLGYLSYRDYLQHGMKLWFSVDGAAGWLGSDSRFVRVIGDFKAFYNLGRRGGNLALWLKGGYMKGGRYPDLFRKGSWTGLRGFYTAQFAARSYLLGTLEYRTGLVRVGFPVMSVIPYFRGKVLGVQAAVFADGGMLAGAGDYRTRESGQPLLSVGAGLRFIVVNLYKAVLRLDFAYTVSPYQSFDFIIASQQYF